MLLLILQIGLSQEPNTLFHLEKQYQKYKFVVNTYKRIVPLKQTFDITMWNVGDAHIWIPKFCQCPDFFQCCLIKNT